MLSKKTRNFKVLKPNVNKKMLALINFAFFFSELYYLGKTVKRQYAIFLFHFGCHKTINNASRVHRFNRCRVIDFTL